MRATPMWLMTYSLMLIPGVLLAIALPAPLGWGFVANIALGGFLDAVGNLAMTAALRSTELSVFGPLNAFRPVLAMLFGWLFLREQPTLYGGAGVAVTVAGAWVLMGGNRSSGDATLGQALRTLGFRLSGLSLSTIGAVYLKRAAVVASAEAALAGWIGCGLACLLAWRALHERRDNEPSAKNGGGQNRWLVLHAAVFFVMQWMTIRIFTQTLLAYSFVYFQLGMMLQVLVGAVLFKETPIGRRFAGCAVMSVGAGLIAWKG
jgi:drug/metabolite transporter (DMT)-like permease